MLMHFHASFEGLTKSVPAPHDARLAQFRQELLGERRERAPLYLPRTAVTPNDRIQSISRVTRSLRGEQWTKELSEGGGVKAIMTVPLCELASGGSISPDMQDKTYSSDAYCLSVMVDDA